MAQFRHITNGAGAVRADCGSGTCDVHETDEQHLLRADVDHSEWDGPAAMSTCSKSDSPASCFNSICAGKKAGDPATQEAHALPHHKTAGGAPNATGVANALSRLPQTQGLTNADAAKAHLQAHMKSINPDYDANAATDLAIAQRVQAAQQRSLAYAEAAASPLMSLRTTIPQHRDLLYPGGAWRATAGIPFETRSQIVNIDGRQYLEVEGYASTFNMGYEMWDMFGPFTEEMDPGAFDKSLAAGPDVAFLVNHKGVSMARTPAMLGNGKPTLAVYADDIGLGMHAFLNYARQDVKDLAVALDDNVITEMSFAFMLNDGWWNQDFDKFRIMEADINRGDVSAVNYGANPYTTIAARAAEVAQSMVVLSMEAPVVARQLHARGDTLVGPPDGRDVAAVVAAQHRERAADVIAQEAAYAERVAELETGKRAGRPVAAARHDAGGRSLNMVRAQLGADE
jgi:HK97 family phage prohead protease